MRETTLRERAARPEDLGRLLLERANAGDVDGVVALYEPDALLVRPDGQTLVGAEGSRHRGRLGCDGRQTAARAVAVDPVIGRRTAERG